MKNTDNSPLISIIMPVYNGEKFIEYALNSILDQSYKNFEIIIIDGNSTDNTVNIIKKYLNDITYFISEKDNGMYNAINKGLKKANGEIICWLNSDDYYFPDALKIVASTFNQYQNISWLTGRKAIINKNNQIIKIGVFKNYLRYFIKNGFYRSDIFGTITQETTFWRKSLIDEVGLLNEELKVAADYDLWIRFAKNSELYSINTLLGAFRMHEGQLSGNKDRYYNECQKIEKFNLKRIFRIIGIFTYFYSMFSSKNKLIINENSEIVLAKNKIIFE